MMIRGSGWALLGLGLALTLTLAGGPTRSEAQAPAKKKGNAAQAKKNANAQNNANAQGGGGNVSFLAGGPRPAQQGYASVLTVTPRWLVIQNERGQQFPVAFDSVGLFLVRWPATAEHLLPGRDGVPPLVEANGRSAGANNVQTDHIDIYRGPGRGLVSPGILTPNLLAIQPNFQFQVNLQFNLFQPLQGVGGGPIMPENVGDLMFVVGPPINVDPLRLGIAGTNWVNVLPSPGGFAMNVVTPGSPSQIKPGDFVYYVAMQEEPKGLRLSQLVVYKTEFYRGD
jgi:hypothetical protein